MALLKKRSGVFIDLGVKSYCSVLDLQIQRVQQKMADRQTPDSIYFVEHPRVFTLGKRGGTENLIVSKAFLANKNIDLVQTDRGGNITYHGPGQAILYPIVDLETNKIAVKDFVYGLEEIMKQTAETFSVKTERNDLNHGIWVNNSKLGSIGLSIKKGISFHGLAMNIFNDLTPFSWIHPCGLSNIAMTSLARENPALKHEISMEDVRDALVKNFSRVFDFSIDMKEMK